MTCYIADEEVLASPYLTDALEKMIDNEIKIILPPALMKILEEGTSEDKQLLSNISYLSQNQLVYEYEKALSLESVHKEDFNELLHYCLTEKEYGIITTNAIRALKAKANKIPTIYLSQNMRAKRKEEEGEEIGFEITTLPGARFIPQNQMLLIKTGRVGDTITILYPQGDMFHPSCENKLISLQIRDIVRQIRIEKYQYSLDEFNIFRISANNYCLKKHLADGHNGYQEYDSTNNDEYDDLLATYL